MFRNTHPRYAPQGSIGIAADNFLSTSKVTSQDAYGLLEQASTQAFEQYKDIMVQRRNFLVRADGEITGYDIPLVIAIHQNECKMAATFAEFKTMCDHIASVNTWSQEQAERMFSWTPMKFDTWILSFLMRHRRLRCFDMLLFVSTGQLKYSGDILVRLLWPDEQLKKNPFNDIQTIICRRYSHDGRLFIARAFIACFSIVGTICSFLPDKFQYTSKTDNTSTEAASAAQHAQDNNNERRPLLSLKDIKDACDHVLSAHFNTSTMRDQRKASNIDLVQGFTIVTEVTKLFLDEIQVNLEQNPNPINYSTTKISVGHVSTFIGNYVTFVFVELFMYFYARVDHALVSVQEFIQFSQPYMDAFFRKVMDNFPSSPEGDRFNNGPYVARNYPRTYFNQDLERIRTGDPVFGEVRFSSHTLQPVIGANFQLGRVINATDAVRRRLTRRCRWNNPRVIRDVIPDGVLYEFDPIDVPLYFPRQDPSQNNITDNPVNRYIRPPSTLQSTRGDPDWYRQSRFNSRDHLQTNARERVRRQVEEEDYAADNIDDDNQQAFVPEADKVRDDSYTQWEAGDVQEEFYREVCNWLVHPGDCEMLGHINNIRQVDTCNAAWIKDYITNGKGANILDDCTNAGLTADYVNHWLAFILLTVRATVSKELRSQDRLQFMRNEPERFLTWLYGPDSLNQPNDENDPTPHFTEMTMDGVSVSKTLFHVNTSSDDPDFNMRLFDELLGLTLCVAYIRRTPGTPPCPIPRDENCSRRHNNMSNVFFMVIRKSYIQANNNNEELDADGNPIQHIRMRMSFSREVMRKDGFAPYEGHTIHFQPICSLASEMRMYRSLFRVPLLLPSFTQRLFGSNCVQVPYTATEVLSPPSNSLLTSTMAEAPLPLATQVEEIRQTIEDQVDEGSLDYLVNCLHHPECRVDDSHFNSLVQTLRVIGSAEQNSSGMCFTQGPPGTGKTNNIIYLLGALLHHSEFGHAGTPKREQLNFRRLDDNILRARNTRRSFKILVVASSNEAVDNILLRLHDEGIPDGEGGFIHPSMLRIAKYNYEVPHRRLHRYTVNEASRLFDRDHRQRAFPTLIAKRRRADECIIFLSTCSSAGSAAFAELHEKPDIIIHDEAANSVEAEALIPIVTTTAQGSEGTIRRCFYIGVGDDNQLPALNLAPSMIRGSRLVKYWKVSVDDLVISLFERMIYHGRSTFSFLSSQYRMHPAISRITSVPFYKLYFNNPLPLATFQVEFNQPTAENVFSWSNYYPLTFIDTSNISPRIRFEVSERAGHYVNTAEAQVVTDILKGLYDRYGNEAFDSRIAVIAPYRSQVQHILSQMFLHLPQHRTIQGRLDRDVKVCTVDSMQGSQRDIVITSVTRSNQLGAVGFVKDQRRLNVSLTRARFVNIIVTDFSTVTTVSRKEGYGIQSLDYIYNKCMDRAENNSSCVAQIIPVHNRHEGDHFYNISPKPRSTRPSTRASSSAGVTNTVDAELVNDTPSFNFASLYPDDEESD